VGVDCEGFVSSEVVGVEIASVDAFFLFKEVDWSREPVADVFGFVAFIPLDVVEGWVFVDDAEGKDSHVALKSVERVRCAGQVVEGSVEVHGLEKLNFHADALGCGHLCGFSPCVGVGSLNYGLVFV